MAYAIEDTIWPSSQPLGQSTKDLISLFFSLAAREDPDAGPRMAIEVFTENAEMISGTGEWRGRDAIHRSRDNAWVKVAARHYKVKRVYVNEPTGCDLMLLVDLRMEFRNGKTLETEFAGRMLFNADSLAAGQPRLELVKVFADSAPVTAALKDD